MNTNTQFLSLARALWGAVLTLMVAAAPLARAEILWTGPNKTVVKSNSTIIVDVLISNAVSLARGDRHWLYNPDGGDLGADDGTPSDTKWAFGDITNRHNGMVFVNFYDLHDGNFDLLLPNNPMVVHLVNEDIYLSLTFSQWQHSGPTYAYSRSTPVVAPPTPTVSITNPASGAVFTAPANVKIDAAAAVTSGSVTNVAFFANSTSLGSDQTAPFSLTTSGLTAGSYALKAVATAGGISATSAVVNVTVTAPGAILLSAPQITNGVFSFNYNASNGQSYVVENSSNLVDWVSLTTNVAASNPVHFTNAFIPNVARYFRVGRLP